eukprot:8649474-Pyramimonas_sp.AAC.1
MHRRPPAPPRAVALRHRPRGPRPSPAKNLPRRAQGPRGQVAWVRRGGRGGGRIEGCLLEGGRTVHCRASRGQAALRHGRRLPARHRGGLT